MTLSKEDIRSGVFNELAVEAEEQAKRFEVKIHEFEGARDALADTAKTIDGFAAQVRKDFDEGKLRAPETPEDYAGTRDDYISEYIFRLLLRTIGRCTELAIHRGDVAQTKKIVAAAEKAAAERSATILRTKIKDEEAQKEAKKSYKKDPVNAKGRPRGAKPISKRKKNAMKAAGFTDEQAYDEFLLKQKTLEEHIEDQAPAEQPETSTETSVDPDTEN